MDATIRATRMATELVQDIHSQGDQAYNVDL